MTISKEEKIMSDNKKNEYTEQDMELSLNDLSGVSGGEDGSKEVTAKDIEIIKDAEPQISPVINPGSFPDTAPVSGAIVRKIL